MRILKQRTRTYVPCFRLSFEYEGSGGSGCSFECDKDGNVDTSKLQPAGLETYKEALSGSVIRWADRRFKPFTDKDGNTDYSPIPGTGRQVTYSVSEGVLKDWGAFHTTPAVGQCNHCYRHVTLDSFTNTCECGYEYNMSGQELSPREFWGEETGESASEILRPYPALDDIYLAGF